MISLSPFSLHTTSLIPVRIQHMYVVIHLPFFFFHFALPWNCRDLQAWMCISSPVSHQQVFFVSHSLCPSFPSTDPFFLLWTLWASKMAGYSMSSFDLIPCAERLLFYDLSWRGTAWLCLLCVHVEFQHQEPSWTRSRGYFHLGAPVA